MREGGYVRYDGRKSEQVLQDCERLMKSYQGSLTYLHQLAAGPDDREVRLLAFHGVGPITANIFLRELRPFWEKANPEPLTTVHELAGVVGIDLGAYERKSLAFCRVESGPIRRLRPAPQGIPSDGDLVRRT